MANKDTTAVAQASVESPEVTLDEFCTRLSDRKVDGRVELIHGFAFTERKAGHIKDTESNFQARFMAYANQPV
jgi:hypothetical protein